MQIINNIALEEAFVLVRENVDDGEKPLFGVALAHFSSIYLTQNEPTKSNGMKMNPLHQRHYFMHSTHTHTHRDYFVTTPDV